ncbi:hypothetical protein [Marinospirillum perlucidum]|nr:hypothetical protein [Marinospirillum perlucidum]
MHGWNMSEWMGAGGWMHPGGWLFFLVAILVIAALIKYLFSK